MGSNATQIHHRSCSKCDHLIKVQMHKVFLNNLWIWLYLGIIKAKLEAEGQSRAQGRDFLHILIQSVSQSVAGQGRNCPWPANAPAGMTSSNTGE